MCHTPNALLSPGIRFASFIKGLGRIHVCNIELTIQRFQASRIFHG